ncbi:ferredoxin--NADP reductase [Tellurirhabdus bombi]|uniref:ferredoxin--NADP reductase n=1 Tax=Tellurirhabdus bombi TaxID=2907205 RepID=UPI001F17D65E|nr:ferredoxin--NADP reductase [Tellurirhabdus bombi]
MNEELIDLHVSEIITETADTKTIVLRSADQQPVPYRAGQFLTFILPLFGHDVRRSYSISSTPEVASNQLSVTIKRVVNGEVSRYLLHHLKVGDTLTSLPPAGRFTLDTNPENRRDIVLIGAGSGITPLFSLLNQALREEPLSHVTLLYSNTHERSIIFRKKLDALQEQFPERFKLIHLLSHPSDDWTGRRGRLNNILLETLLPTLLTHDRQRALFYICGPFDFMRMVQFTLIFSGIKPHQIRKENFVIDPITLTPPPELSRDHRILLKFRGTEYDIDVPAYKSILQAAIDHGIPLPYSCRGGRCSACMARCQSGSVYMTINDVLTEHDLAQGWILTCTGYPESEGLILDV